MTMALTPAHFALGEIRFKKQFSKLNGNEVGLMPIEEFVDLPESQRVGKTPFIYSADSKKRLIRLRVSASVVALVEERRKYWHLLQYLAGQHVSKMSAEYQAGIAALKAQLQDGAKQRDSSLDSFARAMSDPAAVKILTGAGAYLLLAGAGLLWFSGAGLRSAAWLLAVLAFGQSYLIIVGAVNHPLFGTSASLLYCAGVLHALLGSIGNGLAQAIQAPAERDAALVTFMITASGMTLLGIGSAFWGLVGGAVTLLILNWRK